MLCVPVFPGVSCHATVGHSSIYYLHVNPLVIAKHWSLEFRPSQLIYELCSTWVCWFLSSWHLSLFLLFCTNSRDDGWLLAENALGERGLIPSNYVQVWKGLCRAMCSCSWLPARDVSFVWCISLRTNLWIVSRDLKTDILATTQWPSSV